MINQENNFTRRDFIKKGALITAGATLLSQFPFQANAYDFKSPFALPALPYTYNALEPFIDEQTMTIHHTKHHQAYVNNLNNAVNKHEELKNYTLDDLIKNINTLPADVKTAIRNNGGGHWNHTFFWNILTAKTDTKPNSYLQLAIEQNFGSTDGLKDKFTQAALSVFGSGWAWLVVTTDKKLQVVSTPNQDNPMMDVAGSIGKPIMALDVWEHAYYLKYQNMRANYIVNFWNILNWSEVNDQYFKAMQ